MTLCPDKQSHPSPHLALDALAALIAKGRGQRRIYRCCHCDGWHLTSRPPAGRWYDAMAHGGLLPRLKLPGHEAGRGET